MPRTRSVLLALAVALAGLAGYLTAHTILTHTAHRHPASALRNIRTPAAAVAPAGWPEPVQSLDGIPVGFARTPRGAVAACLNYLAALERALLPGNPWSWAQVVRTLTAQPLRARALAGQAGSAQVQGQLASARVFYLASWPLGYRLMSYARASARVTVWTLGAMARPDGSVPATFSTTGCQLDWTGEDWKVAGASAAPGPTPPNAASSGAHVSAFVRAASSFTTVRDVP